MDKQDKKAIKELKQFKKEIAKQRFEEVNLSFEEKVKRHMAAWRGEFDDVAE